MCVCVILLLFLIYWSHSYLCWIVCDANRISYLYPERKYQLSIRHHATSEHKEIKRKMLVQHAPTMILISIERSCLIKEQDTSHQHQITVNRRKMFYHLIRIQEKFKAIKKNGGTIKSLLCFLVVREKHR